MPGLDPRHAPEHLRLQVGGLHPIALVFAHAKLKTFFIFTSQPGAVPAFGENVTFTPVDAGQPSWQLLN
jgi:hypothetical protein